MEINLKNKFILFVFILILGPNCTISNCSDTSKLPTDITYLDPFKRYMKGFNQPQLQTRWLMLFNTGALPQYDLNYLKDSLKAFDAPEAELGRKYYGKELEIFRKYVNEFSSYLADYQKKLTKQKSKLSIGDLQEVALQLKIVNEILTSLFVYGNRDYEFSKKQLDLAFSKIEEIFKKAVVQ